MSVEHESQTIQFLRSKVNQMPQRATHPSSASFQPMKLCSWYILTMF